MKDKLIPKGANALAKVGKSLKITNKLLKEIDSREVVPADDFRVPIPDENFRKYLLEEHGIENDGATVAYGDIKNVTEVICESGIDESTWGCKPYWGIESLEGIEYFAALTSLDCSYNWLTSLDVSKNTSLKVLNCNACRLFSLDVSRNTALEELDCSYNFLTSLDVSKNTKLYRINCVRNHLTSFDISKNTALTTLSCRDNQLTSLDLSNNHSLNRVALRGNPGTWWHELERDA